MHRVALFRHEFVAPGLTKLNDLATKRITAVSLVFK